MYPEGKRRRRKHGEWQAPLIELSPSQVTPDARESLCSIGTKPERPFDRRNNRGGGGVVAPGEGRSIFGPPVGPFLPAMISTRENGDSVAGKPGSPNSRGAPSRCCSGFSSRRRILSLQDGPCRVSQGRLPAVSCRRLPLCLVLGIDSAGSQFLCCVRMSTQATLDLVAREIEITGRMGSAIGVRAWRRTPAG